MEYSKKSHYTVVPKGGFDICKYLHTITALSTISLPFPLHLLSHKITRCFLVIQSMPQRWAKHQRAPFYSGSTERMELGKKRKPKQMIWKKKRRQKAFSTQRCCSSWLCWLLAAEPSKNPLSPSSWEHTEDNAWGSEEGIWVWTGSMTKSARCWTTSHGQKKILYEDYLRSIQWF